MTQECNRSSAYNKIAFLGGIFILMAASALSAQETSLEELPGLRERAIVMRIVSRIIEQNQQVVWDAENARVTIPGRPVGLKLVGANLIVAVQFTPFLRKNGRSVLVAQGQIWINIPNEGMRYHTTMQTIPLELGEQIYFFPLGSMGTNDEASIEIQLVLEPYADLASVLNIAGMDDTPDGNDTPNDTDKEE